MEITEQKLIEARESLARSGIKHKGRPVPFGITFDTLDLPPSTLSRLREAGNTAGNFLAALNKLVTSDETTDLRRIPEVQLLSRPKAAEVNAIAADLLPSMFRLDLMVEPDGGFETSEIELLFGGIGYTDVVRNTIFPRNPTRSLSTGFAKMLNYLSNGEGSRCSIVTVDWDVVKPYVADLALFSRNVKREYPNYDLVYADQLRLDRDGNLISSDNPEPIRFVHRYFEIYMGVNGDIPNFDLLLEAYRRGTARDLPSLKQFLEEKLSLALPWDPRLQAYFEHELTPEGLEKIKAMIPYTRLLSPDLSVNHKGTEVPVTLKAAMRVVAADLRIRFRDKIAKKEAIEYAQNSPHIAQALRSTLVRELQSASKYFNSDFLLELIAKTKSAHRLATLPKDGRQYIIKKSGFSEGAAEAKSVAFLAGITAEQVDQEIEEALGTGDTYVIQEATQHQRFSLSGLVPKYNDYRDLSEIEPSSLELVHYNGYARVEPHYFQTGQRNWELGDVSVTLTPDKKTHMRTDAIVTYVDVD